MSTGEWVRLVVILAVIVFLLANSLRIVPQANSYVVERLGKFHKAWSAGLHAKIPFIDQIAKKVSLKEQVADFPPQPVITKDNVTMRIDDVVFFRVCDPKNYAYGVQNPLMALENLTATTLRNIIGELELDETLTSREKINDSMRSTLEAATENWGIRISRVELRNITPPAAIQDAMEKQMKAERERREAILIAEGEKQSAILVAEGKKQSAILTAEGESRSAILRAEAEKNAMILRAEAVEQASVKEAAGRAEAIRRIQQANADGLEALNEKLPKPEVLQLKSLEAFAKVADGKATKLIIPSDMQNLAGVVSAIVEIADKGAKEAVHNASAASQS